MRGSFTTGSHTRMANVVSPFQDPGERTRAGVFGMACFLISLAMIFIASILAVVVVRLQDPDAWADGGLGLPGALLASTGLLVVSSGTMAVAGRAAARGDDDRLARWMTATLALAIGFLVLQGVAWFELLERGARIDSNLWAWTIYVLTGLHAAHVLGGLVPMIVTTRRARRRAYTIEDHRGVVYVAMYWHFLDGAWIALYATLAWATWW